MCLRLYVHMRASACVYVCVCVCVCVVRTHLGRGLSEEELESPGSPTAGSWRGCCGGAWRRDGDGLRGAAPCGPGACEHTQNTHDL